jgi:hypothetical protein
MHAYAGAAAAPPADRAKGPRALKGLQLPHKSIRDSDRL